MTTLPFFVYDSFTRVPFAGNPAGVFFEADGLSEAQMRTMAGEVSLESAFVSGGPDGLALRYFTAVEEVPLCGHATVAAFSALYDEGVCPLDEEVPFNCPVGRLSVRLSRQGDGISVRLRQTPPVFGPRAGADDLYEVAFALNTTPDAFHPQLPIQTVSTGSPFLFVPVCRKDVVDEAPGKPEDVTAVSHRLGGMGMYVFALDTQASAPEPMVYARNFVPSAGLAEDPVTGSASGALGCYLARYGVLRPGVSHCVAEQGALPRRGRVDIFVERDADGQPSGVSIAGVATRIASGTMRKPGE